MLEKIDLSEEIVKHFAKTKQMIEQALQDPDAKAGEKASAVRTLNDLLSQLVRLQADIYNINRLRAQEFALIESLQVLPEDTKEHFFRLYEEKLSEFS